MAIIHTPGVSPFSTWAIINNNQKALRISGRPNVKKSLANISMNSGTMAATLAANTTIFSFRNSGSIPILIDSFWFSAAMLVAMTTAQAVAFSLTFARGFTSPDTGGTSVAVSGDDGKFDRRFETPITAEARISSTAALTNGTKIQDNNPLSSIVGIAGLGGTFIVPNENLLIKRQSGHPVILRQNEGINLRNRILFGAGGTWVFAIKVAYKEFDNY